MLLQPRKSVYKKRHKGKIKPYLKAKRLGLSNNNMSYLISRESSRLSGVQIEAARVTLNRVIRKYGKLQIRVFPNVPVTKKPNEVRMGQGKGPTVRWIVRIQPQRVIFQIPRNIPQYLRVLGLNAASKKLPFTSYIII